MCSILGYTELPARACAAARAARGVSNGKVAMLAWTLKWTLSCGRVDFQVKTNSDVCVYYWPCRTPQWCMRRRVWGVVYRRRLRRITAAPCPFGSASVVDSSARAWPSYRASCTPSRFGKTSGNAWGSKKRRRGRIRKKKEEEDEEEEEVQT